MTDRRIRVLLIEDNPGDARLIEEFLAEAKGLYAFDLDWADRLYAGMERLEGGGFDAVLLDLGLPESAGIDTFTRISLRFPQTPFIVLTGLDDEELALRAVQGGAQDYLVKGQVDGNLLGRSIRYAIERKRAEEALHCSIEETASVQRLLVALSNAAEAVHRAPTPDQVYQAVVEQVAGLGHDVAVFNVTEDQTHVFVTHFSVHSHLLQAVEELIGFSARDHLFPLMRGGLCRRIIEGKEGVFIGEISDGVAEVLPHLVSPLAGRITAMLGVERVIVAPMGIGGQIQGLLAVSGRSLAEADVPAISTFANQTAIAIEKAILLQRTRELAITDGLTGLYNHRHFHELLNIEVGRSMRYSRPLALAMVDIDHFKAVNDAYGHKEGDVVLRSLAGILQSAARETDEVARYGGEEFVIMLPETSEEAALVMAERMRRAVEEHKFLVAHENIGLTVSVGVASFVAEGKDAGDELIRRADHALYKAKLTGRNRVCRDETEL